MFSSSQLKRGALLLAAVLVACLGSPAAATHDQKLSARPLSEGLPASFGEAKDQAWARMEEALWDTARPYVQASLPYCLEPHDAGALLRHHQGGHQTPESALPASHCQCQSCTQGQCLQHELAAAPAFLHYLCQQAAVQLQP